MESTDGNLPESSPQTNYFTARDSTPRPRPPHPESTATLVKRFNEYKLETEFFHGYVVQRTCEWNRLSSSRLWETSTWRRKGRIGIGGYGTVWLDEKKEGARGGGGGGEQLRAVKILPRDSLPEAGRSQELLALVKLSEYNHLFVKFLGWYEDLDHTYLAMEYMEHGDLSNYIKDSWARTEAKEITRQILEGLEVLHEKGFCHRDLKPQNILIASLDPVWVKIADFGASKRVKNTAARTLTGTLGYTAPEMLGAIPQEFMRQGYIPHALDIWSLGSLVYELLASEKPFIGPLCDWNTDSESGLQAGLPSGPPERGIDFTSLDAYCHGRIEFPTNVLQKSHLGEEGIAFVKSLLVANPNDRLTATHVLQNPWLAGYTYTGGYAKKLKNEFLCLGVDLDFGDKENILMRQVGKGDIMRFLPSSAKARVSSLLVEAVTKGYNLAVSKLLGSPDCGLESIDSLTRGTLFQQAVEARQLDTIKLLLQNKVDIGACISSQTVLQWVVEGGNVNMVNLFLENTTNKSNKGFIEALLLVIKSGRVDMVRAFLNNKVDINAFNGDNQTALQAAAEGGNIDIVQLLLDNKVDVNAGAAQYGSRTALQFAAESGHTDIVELLLDNKADVNAEAARYGGPTALQAAAKGGSIDIVKLLLGNKADVNAKAARNGGRTGLQAAAGGGHIDIVKFLLDNKADVNAKAAENHGRTALQAAAEGGHIDIVKLLLDNKADVNAKASKHNGRTALQAAAGGGNIDVVKLLLDNKADVNAEASKYNGRTALQVAAEGGHTDIVKFLLDNNADVNTEIGFKGRTALQAAAEGGHIDIVKLLLDNKADVNTEIKEGDGRTALQFAVEGGYIDIVKLLLDNKADVNAEPIGDGGRTALQAAAGSGHIDIVKLLLDNKADVNAEPSEYGGLTALQAAQESGSQAIVRILEDFGALY